MLSSLMRLLPLGVAGVAVTNSSADLQEFAQKALDAALRLKSSMELRNIATTVQMDIVAGKSPPRSTRELEDVIERNIDSRGSDPTIDAWGEPYQIATEAGAIYVVSCGPDTRCGTSDDLRTLIQNANGRFGVQRSAWKSRGSARR